MNHSSKKRYVRNGDLVTTLRHEIIQGRWRCGMRLPTKLELQQRFSTTSATLQKSLDILQTTGFIVTRGRAGTFVAARPPHLCRFGLVFPSGHLSRFWTALIQEAAALEKRSDWRLPAYYGIDGHVDVEDYERLVSDLRAQRLAGLILTVLPSQLEDTPLFEQPGLPRIAIAPPDLPNVGYLRLDPRSFVEKALDHLQAHGCRRIAILVTPQMEVSYASEFAEGMIARGMTTQPWWIQPQDPAFLHWMPNVVTGLLRGAPGERPDGLIITDDHLVEQATAVLRGEGFRVPDDLRIVAHCNYPNMPHSAVPVTWLGYHARQVLEACIEYINLARRGQSGSPVKTVPALFEHELSAVKSGRVVEDRTHKKKRSMAPKISLRQMSQSRHVSQAAQGKFQR